MTDDERQDAALRGLYRHGRDEAPSAQVDRVILDAATREAGRRRRQWWKPVSAAAVVLLGATVALQVFEQVPDGELPMPAEERGQQFDGGRPETATLPPPATPPRTSEVQPPLVAESLTSTAEAPADAKLSPFARALRQRADSKRAPVGASGKEEVLGAAGDAPQAMPAPKAAAGAPPTVGADEAAEHIRLPSNLVRLRLLLPEVPTAASLRQALPGADVVREPAAYLVSLDRNEAMRIETAGPDGALRRATLWAPSRRWLPGLPFGRAREALSPDCADAVCAVDDRFSYRYRQRPADGAWVLDAVVYER